MRLGKLVGVADLYHREGYLLVAKAKALRNLRHHSLLGMYSAPAGAESKGSSLKENVLACRTRVMNLVVRKLKGQGTTEISHHNDNKRRLHSGESAAS